MHCSVHYTGTSKGYIFSRKGFHKMRTITVKVTDLGYEELLKAATTRGVSIAEIAEERLTDAAVYEPDPTADLPYTEDEIAKEESDNADRRALREWHERICSRATPWGIDGQGVVCAN
jgi:hypothetical protein